MYEAVPDDPDTELDPYVYTRSAPNRRERRANERRVLAALRASGCRCQPTLVSDPGGRGGWHRHQPGCALDVRLSKLEDAGRPVTLQVVAAPRCKR